jgi:hypothetical protein
MFPIQNYVKRRVDLSPLFSKSAFRYAILKVDVNQEGLKMIGTYQLLLYSDDVNLPGQDINIINKNTEGLLVTSQ